MQIASQRVRERESDSRSEGGNRQSMERNDDGPPRTAAFAGGAGEGARSLTLLRRLLPRVIAALHLLFRDGE